MKDFKELLDATQNLSQKELETLSSKILDILQGGSNNKALNTVIPNTCRRCDSASIIKFGKDKNNKQRFKCKNCNTIFYSDSYSVTSKSHQPLSVWKQYIPLLLKGTSLAACAKECGISEQTAFTWRHKILSSLQSDQNNRALNGIVEIDDMFFSISYKGNHKKSKNFTMPRKSYERGNDNSAMTGGMACVLCACERRGQTYGEVVGVGSVSVNQLEYAFKDRLSSDTLVLSDRAYNYKNYFKTTSIEHIQLAAHCIPKDSSSPPQVKGIYHIQNVNNLHNRFRRRMRPYNGVATKYLNHYVNLFIWIENHKKICDFDMTDELFDCLTSNKQYRSYQSLINLPAVPKVA